jgi:hypothetical protein
VNRGEWDEFGGYPHEDHKPFSWLRTLGKVVVGTGCLVMFVIVLVEVVAVMAGTR